MSEEDKERLFGKVYPDGTVIFREKDPGEEMYIIQDGEVEISSLVNGEKTVWGVLTKGNFFGEMALFDDKPRSATATVKGSARLMVLHRGTVKERLASAPHIGLALLRSMCLRVRSLHQSLEELLSRGAIEPDELDATLRAHAPH